MKGNPTLFFFGWILLLYVFSVTYFLRGFLLTRREIHLKSSDQFLLSDDHEYKRVIILVIDALRYDFINYNNASLLESMPSYHNKLTVIHDLLSSNHALLFKFVADPPTTTMQRLKGLTTGSLPTFIDVGSNFASDELMEDNIIYQLHSAQLNITFMGDDTWMGLFPRSFKHSYPFPSFDVWDIHTVDEGVTRNIQSELLKGNWNLLIAHCLGVDHVGHRYGPYHPIMAEKLTQMNNLISYISEEMDEETILFVMGDHGMTRNGDHGGDSSDETTAGLFVYSPMLNVKHVPYKQVNQIDFVPTLAILMGIPIPYSNLGTVILDLVHPRHQSNANGEFNEEFLKAKTLSTHAQALYSNTHQVWRYLDSYNKETPINLFKFDELVSEFANLQSEFKALNLTKCYQECQPSYSCCATTQELEQFIVASQNFLRKAREMCRSMWARFDLTAMIIGLAIFFVTIIVHVFYMIYPFETVPSLHLIIFLTILSFLVKLFSGPLAIVLLTTAVIYCLKQIVPRNWLSKEFHLSAFLPIIMALLYTSNSFVVEEPYVAHFVTQIVIWATLITSSWDFNNFLARVTLSVSTRIGLLYFRCREEQIPYCVANNFHRSISSLAVLNWIVVGRLVIAVLMCLSLVFAVSSHLKAEKNIFRLVTIISSYWITQLLCVAFGVQVDLANALPWSFYLYFTYSLTKHLIAAFRSGLNHLFDANLNVLLLLWTLALLLAGDGLSPGIVSVLGNIFLFRHCCSNHQITTQVLYGLLSMHGFFATGHHTSLPNIPWEAAFVGFSHASTPSLASNLLPAFLVSYSTASSVFLHALAIPIAFQAKFKGEGRNGVWREYFVFLLFHAVQLFGCMVAATIHRRHLMVWKIFAPRLLFELVLGIYVVFGLLLSLALNHKAKM